MKVSFTRLGTNNYHGWSWTSSCFTGFKTIVRLQLWCRKNLNVLNFLNSVETLTERIPLVASISATDWLPGIKTMYFVSLKG